VTEGQNPPTEVYVPGISVQQMWKDPEIIGRVYLQACKLQIKDLLAKEDADGFWAHATSIMHKLTATKYHLDNYKRLETQEVEATRRRFKKHPNQRREAFELIFEIEAFLFQVKSSLDMLAKLLGPLIDKDQLRLHSFEKKGHGVIKALEGYKQHKEPHVVAAISELIRLIQEDRESWISLLVQARDTASHYRALSNYVFQPYPVGGGVGVRKPRLLSGSETIDSLRLIYSNNIEFHQDFMSVAMAVRLKHLALVRLDPGAMEKEWQSPAGRYVKWGWAIRPATAPTGSG
jgi:hypothetical protein